MSLYAAEITFLYSIKCIHFPFFRREACVQRGAEEDLLCHYLPNIYRYSPLLTLSINIITGRTVRKCRQKSYRFYFYNPSKIYI
jgi:hypothetical protein